MHQSVLDHFREFSVRFEGLVHWPYLDVKGLVTVGIGCLIDPVSAAFALPWVLEDTGHAAPRDQILADWSDLKAQQRLSKLHYNYARPVTRIRLTDEGVDAVVHSKLLANEALLKKSYPAWDTWPADAQLCACSMAWSVGAGFPGIFKNFTNFANQGDWDNAARCAAINDEGNAGIIPRNAANQVCLHNAKTVAARQLDHGVLYWPGNPDHVGDTIHELQANAHRALEVWRGVPYRFPVDGVS